MLKTCFMFSGQGSQKIEMGISLAQCSQAASKIFQLASEILNFDILKLYADKNSNLLFQTQFAQPAIVAVSVAAFKALSCYEIPCQAMLGHSLGSISALIASEALSLEDGFKVVQARANAMQQCENEQSGSMCAIIGATISDIEFACQNASDYVTCANFNSPNQVVISGTQTAVEEVKNLLEKNKKAKRCIMLKVKAAFHSKLMMPAAEKFKQALSPIEFKKPKFDVLSNVTGKKIEKCSDIKKLLIQQIYSPVKFTNNLNELKKANFNTFIEFGPSKPLCALVKNSIPAATTFNVADELSLQKTIEFFTKQP